MELKEDVMSQSSIGLYDEYNISQQSVFSIEAEESSEELLDSERDYFDDKDEQLEEERRSLISTESINLREISLGWRKIIFLPFNPLWQSVILFSVLMMFLIVIYDLQFSTSTSIYNMFGPLVLDILYLIDVILAAAYNEWKTINIMQMHARYHSWQLILDMMSLIPADLFYIIAMGPDINIKFLSYCRINRLLRLNRVRVFFSHVRNTVGHSIIMNIVEWATYFIMLVQVSAAVIYTVKCLDEEKCYEYWALNIMDAIPSLRDLTDFEWYLVSIFILIGRVSNTGYPDFIIVTTEEMFIITSASFIALFLFMGYILGYLNSAIVHQIRNIFFYAYKVNIVKSYMNYHKANDKIKYKVVNFYYVFWSKRYGIKERTFFTHLPLVSVKELCVDIYWTTFKHTHLFKQMDLPFLRFLSLHMTSEFFLAGDNITHRNQLKNKMIYIVSGVVQLLSEEDDKTPLISFSGGTCLGESTLLISYLSNTTIKCATMCEIVILERQAFCKILKDYPHYYKNFLRQIQDRYKNATEIQNLVNSIKQDTLYMNNGDETSTRWIKNTMQDLLVLEDHKEESIFTHGLKKYNVYTPTNLDLYVMSEKLKLVTDPVCLKPTWPWILQPDSQVLFVWNIFVLVIVLIAAIFLPYFATFVCIPFKYKNKPDETSECPNENIAVYLRWPITIIYFADIVVQVLTAVKTKDEVIADWRRIFYYRIAKLYFIVDIVAALPLELFIFLGENISHKSVMMNLLSLNKLLKLWKLGYFFNKMEQNLAIDTAMVRIYKYFLYTAFLIYYCSALFYAVTCFKGICNYNSWLSTWITLSKQGEINVVGGYYNPKENPNLHILYTMYVVNIVITGSCCTTHAATNISDIICIIFIVTVSFFMYIYMIAGLSATRILNAKPRGSFQNMIYEVNVFMQENKLEESIKERVVLYLKTKWQYLNGADIMDSGDIFPQLPRNLRDELQEDLCLATLNHVPLFQNVDKEFLKKVAAISKILLLPPYEIVTYAGEVSRDIYIIMNGYCEVMSNVTGASEKIIGSNDHFAAVEMFLNLPSAITVRTVTHCKFAVINDTDLKRIITMFPTIQMEFKDVVSTCADIKKVSQYQSEKNVFDYTTSLVQSDKKSFYHFGYHWHYKSVQKYDYEQPFKKLGPLLGSAIRVLLLHHTILPDGRFIIWWEIFRALFAFTTGVWFPIKIIMYNSWAYYFGLSLDITAYVDLYVRLHVCYYNEDGIMVKHPLKTAVYYVKHGLLFDLLGCLPFELLAPLFAIEKTKWIEQLALLRVIQCHRTLSGCNYLHSDVFLLTNIFIVLKYVIIVLTILNVATSCICTLSCTFGDHLEPDLYDVYAHGVKCENNSWIHHCEFSKSTMDHRPFTPFRAYIYGFYWMTTTITRCTLAGIYCQTYEEVLMIMIISITGMLLFLLVLSNTVAALASRHVKLTTYQEHMHSLVKLINHRRIHNDLHNEVVNYFEFMWTKKRGTDVHKLFEQFHPSLKQDILFSIYGTVLKECSVFHLASRSFFRVLLTHMKSRILMKHGMILRVNDIQSHLYFLYKGRVDVSSPDGTRLQTIHRGSIFGNFDDTPLSRQTVTMTARSHVELLEIESTEFYKILKNYPHLLKHFEKKIALNTDFVPPISAKETEKDVEGEQYSSSSQNIRTSMSSIVSVLKDWRNKVYSPESRFFKLWDTSVLIVSYLSYIATFYQAALHEFHAYFVTLQYFMDLIYILKIYFKFHMAHEDEFGDIIMNIKKIAEKYRKDPCGLYLDVGTVLPLEIFSFIAGPFLSNEFCFAFSYLRLNRLGRIAFLLQFFNIRSNRLNINMFWIRVSYILLCLTLLLHTQGCIMLMLIAASASNWDPFQMDYLERMWYYVLGLHISVSLITGTSFDPELAKFTLMASYFIFIAIVDQFALGVFIGEMCDMLEITEFIKAEYAHSITKLKKYLLMEELSPALVSQVWRYVVLLWDHRRGSQFPSLLQQAPMYLREGINGSLFGHHIYTNYVFSMCHGDFLRQLVTKLKQYTFFPGNYITFEGDIDHTMYFIYSGEVEVLSEGGNFYMPEIEDILKEGDVFGMEQGLYPQHGHPHNYRARTITIILMLYQPDWEHLLKFFPASRREIYERAAGLHFTI